MADSEEPGKALSGCSGCMLSVSGPHSMAVLLGKFLWRIPSIKAFGLLDWPLSLENHSSIFCCVEAEESGW